MAKHVVDIEAVVDDTTGQITGFVIAGIPGMAPIPFGAVALPAVPAPASINSTNVATYSQLNAPPLSVPAGGVLTIDASAYPGMAAAITVQVGQGGTATLAWSGGALKENAAGTSAANVTLGASGVYVITQSPTGAGVFRLVGGASL